MRPDHLRSRQTAGRAFGERWSVIPLTAAVAPGGRRTLTRRAAVAFDGALINERRSRVLRDEGTRQPADITVETVDGPAITAATDIGGAPPLLIRAIEPNTTYRLMEVNFPEPGRARFLAERIQGAVPA